MSSVTKSFSKNIDQLEDVLYALNKNKISLKVDLSKAKSELTAAEEQFEKTQSAADGFKLELAQANYDNIVRNLETVTQAAGKAEDAISKAGNQGRSADAQTAKTMMTTVAASGIGQMLRDVTMNAGAVVAGSMLGEAGGTIASSMLSSGATGAIAGTAILGPGNENTAALRGWRGDCEVAQALSKGQAVSLLPDTTPDSERSNTDLEEKINRITKNSALAVGIDYVPYDNFPALLHQGERVQTAVEARSQRRVPAITITGNSFSIREDADVDRVASALLRKIELAERRG